MEIVDTNLDGVKMLIPKVYKDARGCFFESYNQKVFAELDISCSFVQDNISVSDKNVLRGLHFQKAPYAQGKLVSVIKGSVLDVVVDIRKDSPTYGQHFKQVLSSDNNIIMWIPPGFAHGFITLEDNTIFFYKCTAFYKKEAEAAIIWNDPNLSIEWGCKNPIVSEKDANASRFENF